jgi:hypothetical protein
LTFASGCAHPARTKVSTTGNEHLIMIGRA